MNEPVDVHLWVVIIGAFAAGYVAVSLLMARLKGPRAPSRLAPPPPRPIPPRRDAALPAAQEDVLRQAEKAREQQELERLRAEEARRRQQTQNWPRPGGG